MLKTFVIRITRAPLLGQEPEWVRQQWVGVVMSFHGVLTSPEDEVTDITVHQGFALDALRAKQGTAEAVQWWEAQGFPHFLGSFTFDRGCVEVISPTLPA